MVRCLVAEDEWYISDLLEHRIKETFGADVILVESGNKAIDVLNHDRNFDFIVSDYQMYDGTGEDLLNFLIENKIKIPFAFFTSLLDEKVGPEDFFLGCFRKDDFDGMTEAIQTRLKRE